MIVTITTHSCVTSFITKSICISETHKISEDREIFWIKSMAGEAFIFQLEEHSQILINRKTEFSQKVAKWINRTQEHWPRLWPKHTLRHSQCFCMKTWQDLLFFFAYSLLCLRPHGSFSYPSLAASASTLLCATASSLHACCTQQWLQEWHYGSIPSQARLGQQKLNFLSSELLPLSIV